MQYKSWFGCKTSTRSERAGPTLESYLISVRIIRTSAVREFATQQLVSANDSTVHRRARSPSNVNQGNLQISRCTLDDVDLPLKIWISNASGLQCTKYLVQVDQYRHTTSRIIASLSTFKPPQIRPLSVEIAGSGVCFVPKLRLASNL